MQDRMCAACGDTETISDCKSSSPTSTGSSLCLDEQLRISKSQFDQLERENARVVTQLKEVIKMNAHWQRYDAQREEYVQKLTRTNQELQDKVENLQKLVDELLNKSDSSSDRSASPRELSTESPGSSSSNRDEEIAALREKISILERGRASRKKADDDELAMLREQINVCVDDFKQERKDRERIHGENQRLKERLAQTEQTVIKNEEQMFVYQEQIKRLQERCQLRPVPSVIPGQGFDEPCCYPEDRPQYKHGKMHVQSPYVNRRTFRHPVYMGDDLTDLPSDVEIDGLPAEPEDVPDGQVPARNGAGAVEPEGAHLSRGGDDDDAKTHQEGDDDNGSDDDDDDDGDDEPLQCPRCLASFSINKHADLLDHINICME